MQCQAHAYGVASCGNQRPVKTTLTRIRFRAILGRFLVFYILFTATLVLRQFVYCSLHQQQLQAVCSMPTATAFRAFLSHASLRLPCALHITLQTHQLAAGRGGGAGGGPDAARRAARPRAPHAAAPPVAPSCRRPRRRSRRSISQ